MLNLPIGTKYAFDFLPPGVTKCLVKTIRDLGEEAALDGRRKARTDSCESIEMYSVGQRRSTRQDHTRVKDCLSLGDPDTHLGVFTRQGSDQRFLERETGTRGRLVSLRVVQGITFGILTLNGEKLSHPRSVMTSCQ